MWRFSYDQLSTADLVNPRLPQRQIEHANNLDTTRAQMPRLQLLCLLVMVTTKHK